MRLENLAKLKASFSQKRKAWVVTATLKKARTMEASSKNIPAKQSPNATTKVTLATLALPPPSAPSTLSPVILASATHLTPTNVLSRSAPVEGSLDPEALMDNILQETIFKDWRVIWELVKRMLLLIELERIEEMGSNTLRRIFVAIMNQIHFLLIMVLFLC